MTLKGNADIPQRSCLGCRTSKDKDRLLRFVLTPDGEVLPDLDSRLPGRGAYTCINRMCVTDAVSRQQFKRAFKRDVSVMPAGQLVEHIERMLYARITGLIGLANKAGALISGGTMVGDALKGKQKPGLVIIATDVSEAVGSKIIFSAAANGVVCRSAATKDSFGEILGKAPRSAIAVSAGGFVLQLLKSVDRYKNFLGEV